MKQYSLFLILKLGLMACQDIDKPKKPKKLIPKEEMTEILMELYLANAARSVNVKTMEASEVRVDSLIFEKFGIDSLQFAENDAYYAADLNSYQEMFTVIEERLNRQEKILDSLLLQEKDKNHKPGSGSEKDSLP